MQDGTTVVRRSGERGAISPEWDAIGGMVASEPVLLSCRPLPTVASTVFREMIDASLVLARIHELSESGSFRQAIAVGNARVPRQSGCGRGRDRNRLARDACRRDSAGWTPSA